MPKVEVYCTPYCPYCVRAKNLLESKNIEYEEFRVDLDADKRNEMIERSKRTSVPQIFIDDHHVGGCDDLYELEANQQLDTQLGIQ